MTVRCLGLPGKLICLADYSRVYDSAVRLCVLFVNFMFQNLFLLSLVPPRQEKTSSTPLSSCVATCKGERPRGLLVIYVQYYCILGTQNLYVCKLLSNLYLCMA